jgi:hypothetical protein
MSVKFVSTLLSLLFVLPTFVSSTPLSPTKVDSTLQGEITTHVKLQNTKIYGIKGYVYVNDGAILEIQKGTIIVGDEPGNNSAIIINRGGKIIAEGTPTDPIVFTSRAPAGQRQRGDWGGIVICGKGKTNHPSGQAAIEGGIADVTTGGKGWFGGNDDSDNSGILRYVRIEFPGIALSPNNELNGLTLGGVGNKTIIDHVQVSYSNDDAFEWFGGSVNANHLISYGTLDDDFDTDNGFRGKVQFGISKRFRTVADVSTSQTFESDNDAQSSYNQPMTSAVFSNITGVGPIEDTSWTMGSGQNQYNSKFGAAIQIRRNSRISIHNSVFVGWPRGLEIAQVPTMVAAGGDSLEIKNNSWYGVKGSAMTLAGGTPPTTIDQNWITKKEYGNVVEKSTPSLAEIQNPFLSGVEFNPSIKNGSPLENSALFGGNASDSFFEKVSFRGAVGLERWDLGWTEYDPINKEYTPKTVSVNEEPIFVGMTATAFPNPTTSFSTIRYTLNSDDVVDVKLVGITGNVISTFITQDHQISGIYEFKLITTDLVSGIYFLTITGRKNTITLPISVR